MDVPAVYFARVRWARRVQIYTHMQRIYKNSNNAVWPGAWVDYGCTAHYALSPGRWLWF